MAEDKVKTAKTDPIVDRLTREGELLRNSGANSIRSVKIELAKFANVFESIQMATTSTAKALGTLESTFNVQDDKQDSLIEQLKNASDEDKERAREALRNKKEKESEEKGLYDRLSESLGGLGKSIKSGFASMKENSFNFLKRAAQFLIFGPILLGAIKGVLDGIFGENKVQEVFTKIAESPFTKFILDHPWASLSIALVAFAGVKWAAMAASMFAAAKMMGVQGGTDVIGGGGGGDTDGKDKKGSKGKKGKFRFGKSKYGLAAAALVGGGIGLFNALGGDDDVGGESELAKMEDEIKQINEDAKTAESKVMADATLQFEKDRVGMSDVLTDAAISAGIGFAVGGPIGAGVAAAGAVVFSGMMRLGEGVIDYYNDIDEISNETENLINDERIKLNKGGRRAKKLSEEDKNKLFLETNNNLAIERDRIAAEGALVDAELKKLEDGLNNPDSEMRNARGRGGRAGNLKRLEREIAELKEERIKLAKQEAITRRILDDRLKGVEAKPVTQVVDEITENIISPNEITPVVTQTPEQMKDASSGDKPIVNVINNVGGATNVNASKTDNQQAVTKTINQANLGGGGGGGSDPMGVYPNGAV